MEQLDQWEERILQQQPFSLTYEGAPFSQLGWPCRREQQWRGRTRIAGRAIARLACR